MNRTRAYAVRNALIIVLIVLLLAAIALLVAEVAAADNGPVEGCPVGMVCLVPGTGIYIYCEGNSLVDAQVVDDRTVIVFCDGVTLIPVWQKD